VLGIHTIKHYDKQLFNLEKPFNTKDIKRVFPANKKQNDTEKYTTSNN